MRQRINTAAVVLCVLAIIAGSLAHPPEVATSGPSATAPLAHLAAYFILAAGLLTVFHDTPRGHRHAIIAAAGLGLGLELVQSQLPWRTGSLADVLINTAGASLILLDHDSRLVSQLIDLEERVITRLVGETSL